MAAPSIEDLLIAADWLEANDGPEKENCIRVATLLRAGVESHLKRTIAEVKRKTVDVVLS